MIPTCSRCANCASAFGWSSWNPRKTALRGKLNAIMAPANRYVFVNRAGLKVLEQQRRPTGPGVQAWCACASWTMALLFERALASVVGHLRQLNRGK